MTTAVDHEAVENSPALKPYYDNRKLLYRNVFWVICGGGAAGLGLNTAQSLMPLHMDTVGLNAEQISLIMALPWYVGVPLTLYIAHLTDHWQWKMGRRLPFLALSLPFIVAGLLLFPFTAGFVGCMFVYMIFTIFVQIKFDTYPFLIYDISKQKYWGRINGINVVMGAVFVALGQRLLMPLDDSLGTKFVYNTPQKLGAE